MEGSSLPEVKEIADSIAKTAQSVLACVQDQGTALNAPVLKSRHDQYSHLNELSFHPPPVPLNGADCRDMP